MAKTEPLAEDWLLKRLITLLPFCIALDMALRRLYMHELTVCVVVRFTKQNLNAQLEDRKTCWNNNCRNSDCNVHKIKQLMIIAKTYKLK